MSSFWQKLERPIKVLAPMAGYTDSAFRLLCREYGADAVVTELISADAIAYGKFRVERTNGKTIVKSTKNHNTAEMLSFFEAERPLVVQLFGKYPEKFAKAAKWISEELKLDGIDINMGCPARKVVGSDHGAALLKNPDLAVEIVKAVKANTDLPVSVKTRLGWDNDDQILEFGPKIIEAGAEAITVHGRTYKDGFKGQARWSNIYELKQILGERAIVIGNGDIGNNNSLNDKPKIINEKHLLDGYAIGRAAFGKPWIFGAGDDKYLESGTRDDLKSLILKHAQLTWEMKGKKGIIEFRKHLLCYLRGFEGAKELRSKAVTIETLTNVEELIAEIGS